MIQPSGHEGIFIADDEPGEKLLHAIQGMLDKKAAPLSSGNFAAFASRVKMDLEMIAGKPVGADLLRLIGLRHGGTGTTGGNKVYIVPNLSFAASRSGSTTFNTGGDRKTGSRRGKHGDHIRLSGKGSSAVVHYINQALDPDIDSKKTATLGVPTPAFVSLAHEMIHAYHFISGNRYDDSVDGVMREEIFTTGLGPYESNRISEAAIRKEHGLALRTHYYSVLKDAKILSVTCEWLS